MCRWPNSSTGLLAFFCWLCGNCKHVVALRSLMLPSEINSDEIFYFYQISCLSYLVTAWIGTLQRYFQLVGSHMFRHIFSFSQIPFADGALKDKDVKEDHLLTKSLTFFFPFSLLAERTTFLFPLTSFSQVWFGKIIRLPIALVSSSFLAYYRI